MNYKTLLLGALIIMAVAGVSAYSIPKMLEENKTQTTTDTKDATDTTTANTSSESKTAADDTTTENPDTEAVTETPATTPTNGYTMTQVAPHNSRSDCWTAISGNVYDLTPFISSHPGGASNIMKLCGIDGTSLYNSQHGGQNRPANELADLYLGPLN